VWHGPLVGHELLRHDQNVGPHCFAQIEVHGQRVRWGRGEEGGWLLHGRPELHVTAGQEQRIAGGRLKRRARERIDHVYLTVVL
jgi:hypothetical protein